MSLLENRTASLTAKFSRNRESNCGILYVVGQLRVGGSERQLFTLLRAMDRPQYLPNVVVWSFQDDDHYVHEIRKLGVPITGFPRTLSPAAKLLAFRRMTTRMQPQIVHSYSFYTNFAAWWATKGTKITAIGSSRGDLVSEMRECGFLLGRLSARFPRNQIYNNFLGARAAMRSHAIFSPRRITVVRNGVDLQAFRMTPLSTTGPVRILGIGSLLAYKRWDRLLNAASELNKRNLDFKLEIAGEGPLRKYLEKKAQDLGLSSRVTFLGQIDSVSVALAEASFLAHTSETEGCPNVIMEAMACGRAVVAVDAGDISSLVEHGKTGFVVNSGDDNALVVRMESLITDLNLCRRMGDRGRAKAERDFGLSRLLDEMLQAYRLAGWRDY